MPEELAKTQEVFITGTAAEVTPVGEIDGQTFTVGEITQELMTAYSDLVRKHQKASASAA
jgi:branched-chain amino acid aminotransferase